MTIHDVAKRCGYSITVVSHALNNNPRVNQKTRDKIKRVAQKMGYVPNAIARSFAMKRTETIGVVVPGIVTSFYPEVIRGIKATMDKAGYGVMLGLSEDDPSQERTVIDFLKGRKVDGLIIAPCGVEKSPDHITSLIRSGLSSVLIDRYFPDLDSDRVTTDNIAGSYEAVKYLLGLGHKRIALVRAQYDFSSTVERVGAYQQALQDHGIPFDPGLILKTPFHFGDEEYQIDPGTVRTIMAMKDRPTAAFVIHDMLAIGFINMAVKLGLRVPEDISVVGFDDLKIVPYTLVPLTTVAQPKYEMGRIAAEILLAKIKDKGGKAKKEHIRLPAELVVRQSAGRHERRRLKWKRS